MFFSYFTKGGRKELRVRVVLEEGQDAPALLGRGRQDHRAAQQRGQENGLFKGTVKD